MSIATWLSRAAITAIGRTALLPAVSLYPGSIRSVATRTRIPRCALVN
jgi:hypothetical protein